jgi:MSHA biogenesis protein MshQ
MNRRIGDHAPVRRFACWLMLAVLFVAYQPVLAATQEFNSTGGTNATNGLRFFINDNTQLQVRRLNNTGQVFAPNALPPSTNLDNGIFLRANGRVFGPDHDVTTFAPTGGMYNNATISAVSPPNPSSVGDQQTATSNFGITLGPQVTVVWKYTTPFDFITAEVTLVIPPLYPVSASNPVRYYHVIDTFLGGSDNGCGLRYVDNNGKQVVGTYPPASGTSCPSSTSIPAGVSIVESFRERSGLPFSHYCANNWSSFWRNGGVNCSILQSANMSNAISTAFQDTGVGIQYNFTAPGTYTFSYDFVVGSPAVPPYDHLEIRHPGTANLCPTPVQVLGCSVSIVPCPAASIVSTGSLSGSIRTTPGAPAISENPDPFTVGSGSPITNVTLTGSGAGTFTLSSNGLTTTPLNGTRCWNTSNNTESCTYTITNQACVSSFECLETGLAYQNLASNPAARNPLYTKVSGNGFVFDVVALQSNGSQANSYTANSGVRVELFDDSATPQPACSAYTGPIASQNITFNTSNAGRITLPATIVLNRAYRKLRCRVTDANVGVAGCSSDQFAVRPSSLIVTSTGSADADASGSNAIASPRIRAGANFSLSANTNVLGYNGTPEIDNTRVAAHIGAVQNGVVSGNFSVANAANGNATGNAFNYSEAGYFRFLSNGVFDDSFTSVDSVNGDCATGFNTSGGRVGCSFGNTTATNYFGRFIPDHFAITSGDNIPACSSAFTYFGQDGLSTAFTLSAQNTGNTTTQNYTGTYAKLGVNTWANFNFTASVLPTGSLLSASATAPTGNWASGIANVVARHLVSRPTQATGPTNITISTAPVDADGVTMPITAVATASPFRFGRLFAANSYGSELLPLSVPIEAQYWNGMTYQRNQLDNCTVIPANTIQMGNYRANLNACETQLIGAGSMSNGKANMNLSRPGAGNSGSVELSINLNAAAGSTCNSATASAAGSASAPWFGNTNPSARATFGIYKSPVIYLRENF